MLLDTSNTAKPQHILKKRKMISEDENLMLDRVYNIDVLFNSYYIIRKRISFKYQVQVYGLNLLKEISNSIEDYKSGRTCFQKGQEFIINERGKTRHITPVLFQDRVPIHAFTENILIKELRKYLIYDNCASLKGKGLDMQRDRFEVHLRKYFKENHSNKGYVLLGDFSKFFDNIDHNVLIREVSEKIQDREVIKYLRLILRQYRVDGSFMTDEEFESCKTGVYNSLDFCNRSHRVSEPKYIEKSLGIGNEVSQISGLFLPHKIDNYVKIVRGCKYYGRYMDDFYIIHQDKAFLLDVLEGIKVVSRYLNIHLNDEKIKILRTDKPIIFLKIKFKLTDSGKVIRQYQRNIFIREHKKLIKLSKLLEDGKISFDIIQSHYRSWRGNILRTKGSGKHAKPLYHNKKSIKKMDSLYNNLFIIPFMRGELTYGRE